MQETVKWFTYLRKGLELVSVHIEKARGVVARSFETLRGSGSDGNCASRPGHDHVVLETTVEVVAHPAAAKTMRGRGRGRSKKQLPLLRTQVASEVAVAVICTGSRRPGIPNITTQAHST